MPILNAYERSLLLPALWQLARAKWDVLRRPAAEWMPSQGEGQGAGSGEQQGRSTQHAEGSGEQQARSTQHVAEREGVREQQARSTQHAAGREGERERGGEEEKCLAVVRVIGGLGRRAPWSSVCLDQALAAHRMLKKRGLKHSLHLGVRKLPDGTLEAHAWISDDDKIILGRSDRMFQEVATFHFTG